MYMYNSTPPSFGVQSGWDSAAGKDFNRDLGAELDSLNKYYYCDFVGKILPIALF